MYQSIWAPLACAGAVIAAASIGGHAMAQSAQQKPAELPPVIVEQSTAPAKEPKAKRNAAVKQQPQQTASAPPPSAPATPTGVAPQRAGSLSVPSTGEAAAAINRTPGSVDVVPDTAYKGATPAITVKDVLDYVPGVFAQPKWGEDTRLSIRGSGLS